MLRQRIEYRDAIRRDDLGDDNQPMFHRAHLR
jgi:hypothetical protein